MLEASLHAHWIVKELLPICLVLAMAALPVLAEPDAESSADASADRPHPLSRVRAEILPDGSAHLDLTGIHLTETRAFRGPDGELYILCVDPHGRDLEAHLHRAAELAPPFQAR